MRLISQDGMIDVPYEISALSVCKDCSDRASIRIRSTLFDDRPFIFADYSTEEKAKKVMEMVRKKYLESTEIIDGNICYTTLTRAVVFQFPSDDEVEV